MTNTLSPQKIITEIINKAFLMVELPLSNNPPTQQMLAELFIADAMVSTGTTRKKRITDELKTMHQDALEKAAPNVETILDTVAPFQLSAKVGNPKKNFDKDMFIKEVAKKYDLSVTDLISLSKSCVKPSAAPKSFTVSVDNAL